MSRENASGQGSRVTADLMQLPDREALTRGLVSVLCANQTDSELTVVDRDANLYATSFPSEIVTCRTSDGETIRLFCKYGHPERGASSHGHRHGVAHEAATYAALLRPLRVSVPHCYGSYEDLDAGRRWLVLEYLDGALRVSRCVDPDSAMVSAAGWLGDFQARSETGIGGQGTWLRRYDRDYYRGWTHRALACESSGGQTPRWLQRLCGHADGFIRPLLEAPPAVIHGEFYPENILSHEGRILPVDWETTALGAGEIDLASLTERWPPELGRACAEDYRRSRCLATPPAHFERALDAARVYWQLRWLGDRSEGCRMEMRQWRLLALREAGERLSII